MCQCVNWLRNICFAITLQVISTLAHWHINFQFRPPFQRIWVSVDLYVHFAACCKNFKDTLDGYLADCSGSRLFLGV